jgi:pimeloyl-ACP methyl ester carboxylesterase
VQLDSRFDLDVVLGLLRLGQGDADVAYVADVERVFVNSLMTNQKMWDGVLPRLSKKYNLITYDQRGHGIDALGDLDVQLDSRFDLDVVLGLLRLGQGDADVAYVTNQKMWDGVLPRLSKKYNLITYDQRGHGKVRLSKLWRP